jgi:hypothetical protein
MANKITAADVQLWAGLIPVIGQGVAPIIALFRLMRRSRGEPEEQPGDEEAAAEILAAVRAQVAQSVEEAKDPWRELRDLAREQTK